MTKEKNINASAEKGKFADDVLTEDELDNVAGGTGGKEMPPLEASDLYGVVSGKVPYGVGGK